MPLNESMVEDAALEWFGELGYALGHGPHLQFTVIEGQHNRRPDIVVFLNGLGIQARF